MELTVGMYAEYLDRNLDFQALAEERKTQLQRIAELRGGRDVLVFAADFSKHQAPVSISYADLVPFFDQLSNLRGTKLDLILETPGGSGEVAEDMIRALRGRYEHIGVIVPGWAKSAGTIIAMSADEILMEPSSALGPIDAQIGSQGKVFSAGALLEGLDKIKREVAETGVLNKAYIPILQGISPGEIEHARNAQEFAKTLVTDCLVRYKFKYWHTHSSTGQEVTDDEKRRRAGEIADQLRDHARWLTHGRSIKLDDFAQMRLLMSDYAENAPLAEAIRRYHTLLRMTFDTNVYKVFETPVSQIYRFIMPVGEARPGKAVKIAIRCEKCNRAWSVQANLEPNQTIEPGCVPFPPGNKLRCPECNTEHDLSDLRRQIEMQAKRPII